MPQFDTTQVITYKQVEDIVARTACLRTDAMTTTHADMEGAGFYSTLEPAFAFGQFLLTALELHPELAPVFTSRILVDRTPRTDLLKLVFFPLQSYNDPF
jgi:hypothetical protein